MNYTQYGWLSRLLLNMLLFHVSPTNSLQVFFSCGWNYPLALRTIIYLTKNYFKRKNTGHAFLGLVAKQFEKWSSYSISLRQTFECVFVLAQSHGTSWNENLLLFLSFTWSIRLWNGCILWKIREKNAVAWEQRATNLPEGNFSMSREKGNVQGFLIHASVFWTHACSMYGEYAMSLLGSKFRDILEQCHGHVMRIFQAAYPLWMCLLWVSLHLESFA